jgi:hypothetical protein
MKKLSSYFKAYLKSFLLILSVFSGSEATLFAQTVLVSPTGNGGFESGTTFSANSWVEVNGTQSNKWFVGTAASGFTGARCAYVGSASNTNNYVNTTSVVHFYRDIPVPAGIVSLDLSFNWKGVGENGADYMRVYVVGTNVTPTAGTLLTNGQLGSNFNLSSTWQSASLPLPCNLGGTTIRLVFSWRNNNSTRNNPAAAIDNISLIGNAGPVSCSALLGTGLTTVTTLPYNSGSGTTCGSVNDLTSANTLVCGANYYLDGEDAVWSFTPSASGQITISLDAPAASWTSLILYRGCPVSGPCAVSSATCVAISESSSGSKSFCVNVVAGEQYFLVLDSWPLPDCNAYNNLTISAVTQNPAGTTCSNPEIIQTLPYTATNQSTLCMGNEYSSALAGSCTGLSNIGEDKVYQFTTSASQCIGISLSNLSYNFVSVSVYQGCPGSGGVCLGTINTATLGTLSYSTVLPAAGTYYIIVDSDGPSVNYNIQVTASGSSASNDRPFQATPLIFNIPIPGNNNCSSNQDEPAAQPSCFAPAGANPVNTVWFSFTAPSSGCVKIRTSLGTLKNTQIAAYGPVTGNIAAGSGSTLPLISCNQDLPPCGTNTYPSSELTLSGLVSGMNYYVSVDGYGGQTGSFTILIIDAGVGCNIPFPPVPGQDCSLAFPLCKKSTFVADPGPQAVGSICEFTSGANCLASGERGSFWYKIRIVSNGFLEFDIVPNDWAGAPSTTATDYDFAIWRTQTAGVPGPANCSNLGTVAPISCDYSFLGVTGCFGTANSVAPAAYPGFNDAYMQRIAVSAGDEYLLNVSNFTNSTSGFSLNFSSGSPIATTPSAGGTLIWTGSLNTDWFNPENWGGCAVPACQYNVSISSIPVNQPSVSGLSAICGSLDLTPGSSLTLQPNSNLQICGNLVVNGTLNSLSNSTVLMQSDLTIQDQSITGVLTGSNKIWNLTVNKPSTTGGNTVLLNNDMDNAGNFILGNSATYAGGVFNVNGKYHKVAGDFRVYYNAPPLADYIASASTLELNGSGTQNYFNAGTLNNLVLNNTGSGVVLGNSLTTDWMKISGNLTLTMGQIVTGVNRVHVLNTIPGSVSAGNTTSFVNGNLKRAYAASGGTYEYPVGTTSKGYQRLSLNFGNSNNRASSTVWFSNSAPATQAPFLGPECASAIYDQAPLNNGLWNVETTPANVLTPYSVTAYNNNFTNASGGFSIKTRQGAGLWSLEGACDLSSTINAVRRSGLVNLSNLTQFATAQSSLPLPVELLSFSASSMQKFIRLDWATASETGNSGFEVFRSMSPPEFNNIGWVAGAGNSSSLLQYEFDDFNVTPGRVYYYKLRQVDFNGNYEWSETIAAVLSGNGLTLSAIPNPYKNRSNINLNLGSGTEVVLEVYSKLGQLVQELYRGQLDAGTHVFEFGASAKGFPKGVYTVRAVVDNEIYNLRIIETH